MTSPANTRNPPGFTLLEILVVLSILGLVLALFASRGADRNQTLILRRAADGLAEGLRTARSNAILSGHPVALVLTKDPPSWSESAVDVTLLPGDMTISATTAQAFGATAPTDRIRFEPDGSSNGGDILLSHGTQSLAIDVDWLTGRVQVVAVAVARP